MLSVLVATGPIEDVSCQTLGNIDLATPEEIAMYPSARTLHSHSLPQHLPDTVFKRKIILVFRNPKDTAVSLYHFLQKDRYIGHGLKLSWNCFIDQWMTDNGEFSTITFTNITFTINTIYNANDNNNNTDNCLLQQHRAET